MRGREIMYCVMCLPLSYERLCTCHRLCRPFSPTRASNACPGVIEAQVELAVRRPSNQPSPGLRDHTTTIPPYLRGLLHRVKFCMLAVMFVTPADPMTE